MEPSENYKTFFQYVFGDYRYYYYNGLPEEVIAGLDGMERTRAEKLVLQDIKKVFIDVRAIRAAGYLKLKEAIPVLEKRFAIFSIFMRKEIRSSITWALLKIKHDKRQLGKIIDVVKNKGRLNGLTRADAIDLISEFGEEPFVVDTLLRAFLEEDLTVFTSAHYALRKIFKNNQDINDLFQLHGFAPPFSIRDSIVKQIELQVRN